MRFLQPQYPTSRLKYSMGIKYQQIGKETVYVNYKNSNLLLFIYSNTQSQ